MYKASSRRAISSIANPSHTLLSILLLLQQLLTPTALVGASLLLSQTTWKSCLLWHSFGKVKVGLRVEMLAAQVETQPNREEKDVQGERKEVEVVAVAAALTVAKASSSSMESQVFVWWKCGGCVALVEQRSKLSRRRRSCPTCGNVERTWLTFYATSRLPATSGCGTHRCRWDASCHPNKVSSDRNRTDAS